MESIIQRNRKKKIIRLVRSKHFERYIASRPRGEILRLIQEIRTNDDLYKSEIQNAVSTIYYYANKLSDYSS